MVALKLDYVQALPVRQKSCRTARLAHRRERSGELVPHLRARPAGCPCASRDRAAWRAGRAEQNAACIDEADLPQLSLADVAFMQGMIMHHPQAVEMTALIASHTENKDVRSLGAKISSSQSDEIRFMQRWLAARGEATPWRCRECRIWIRRARRWRPCRGC